MSDVLVRDLDPQVLERLKTRAKRHGRSLQGEVKAILEAVAPLSMSEARSVAEQWQQRLAGQIQGDSSELLREDRER
jgi:plasmid stability protein